MFDLKILLHLLLAIYYVPASALPPPDLQKFSPPEDLHPTEHKLEPRIAQTVPAIPDAPDDINGHIPLSGIQTPHPDFINDKTGWFKVPSPQMPSVNEFSPLNLSTTLNLKAILGSQYTSAEIESININQLILSDERRVVGNDYKQKVQEQLTTPRGAGASGSIGYVDEWGYLVEWQKSTDANGAVKFEPDARGEATYFTAIAVVTLASGNYKQDSWEAENANTYISSFLSVLEYKSWGNQDSSGQKHPIRHPDFLEYYGNGRSRNRPLSKDSFGQIVLACYYAYTCPNSSSQVRKQAQSLLRKWISYLARNKWLLHSRIIANEYDSEEVTDEQTGKKKKKYVNLFADPQHRGRIKANGPETYLLYPHELVALKNCAIEIVVPHEVIIPPRGIVIAIDESYILPLVRQSGEVIDKLYDRLQWRKKYTIDLIPGWKKGRVEGTFSIGAFGIYTKQEIRTLFEATVQKEIIAAIKLNGELDGIVDRVLAPLSQFLYLPTLQQILRELVDQLAPWLDPMVLTEFVDFATALQVLKLGYDPANAGYALWPFVMEIESRPYLRVLFEPLFRDFFRFIDGKDNPNGLWGWLANRNDVVVQQLRVFEDAVEPTHWTGYAYGENEYNKWIVDKTVDKNPDHACSRVDYLVLNNLAEKGLPEIPVLDIPLEKFLKLAREALETFIKDIQRQFSGEGYLRRWVDELGRVVEEWFSLAGISNLITIPGGDIVRTFFNPAGPVDIVTRAGNGAFKSLQKFAKIGEDGFVHMDDLLEDQIRSVDGVLKFWKWGPGKVLQNFAEYAGVPDSGAVTDALRTILLVRDFSGELSQWIRSNGVLKSLTKWGVSTAGGFTIAEKRILQKVRTETGELLMWTYHPDGALKEFSKWSKSAADLSAKAADQVMVCLTDQIMKK